MTITLTPQQKWKKNNKEKIREYELSEKGRQVRLKAQAKYRVKFKEVNKEKFFIKKYGLTFKQYEDLKGKQNGVCAICTKPETSRDRNLKVKPLSVDHCHKTGKTRGLLCSKCNSGIGYFEDNYTKLLKAIKYLKKYE